jgi:hypothetical protein
MGARTPVVSILILIAEFQLYARFTGNELVDHTSNAPNTLERERGLILCCVEFSCQKCYLADDDVKLCERNSCQR